MTIGIGRRKFVATLGAALSWPFAVRAQQATMPVIGFLNTGSQGPSGYLAQAFRQGLGERGFVEGQNVAIDYQWTDGRYDNLQALAADLTRKQVAVIFAGGTAAPALAAKAATSTIPIVFTSGDEPVRAGLVSSLNRPGGNITGVHIFLTALSAKKVGLLHDLLPHATVIGACLNSSNRNFEAQATDLRAAATSLGLKIKIVGAGSASDFEAAFTALAQSKVGAVIIGSDPLFFAQRDQLLGIAARFAIPAMYTLRAYVADGGLMSYGTVIEDAYRQAGIYAARILKGKKPGDLPVAQSTKFEFVLNLKTAKTLGLKISDNLLSLADEVIE
jgi:putative ABC transport system substrate-binding protein